MVPEGQPALPSRGVLHRQVVADELGVLAGEADEQLHLLPVELLALDDEPVAVEGGDVGLVERSLHRGPPFRSDSSPDPTRGRVRKDWPAGEGRIGASC